MNIVNTGIHTYPFRDQAEFMTICGQTFDKPTAVLYAELVFEEVNELVVALANFDRVEAFDALLDICFVAAGWDNSLRGGGSMDFFTTTTVGKGDAPHLLMQLLGITLSSIHAARFVGVDVDKYLPGRVFHQAWKLGLALQLPMAAGWDEVHLSNMAKADAATGKIVKRADGKVLKPEGWVKPNLAAVLSGLEGNYVGAASPN